MLRQYHYLDATKGWQGSRIVQTATPPKASEMPRHIPTQQDKAKEKDDSPLQKPGLLVERGSGIFILAWNFVVLYVKELCFF